MLKIQYPDANGLKDPVLGQVLIFAVYQTTPFVQVLHDGSLHWIDGSQTLLIVEYLHWNLFITFYQKRKHPLK